jgi:hypothetical protein
MYSEANRTYWQKLKTLDKRVSNSANVKPERIGFGLKTTHKKSWPFFAEAATFPYQFALWSKLRVIGGLMVVGALEMYASEDGDFEAELKNTNMQLPATIYLYQLPGVASSGMLMKHHKIMDLGTGVDGGQQKTSMSNIWREGRAGLTKLDDEDYAYLLDIMREGVEFELPPEESY